jgi:hypothetical protein
MLEGGSMRGVPVLFCCVALLAAGGCATPAGVEVAGFASQVTPPPSTAPLPSGTPVSADPVAILREDPQVSDKVKTELVPCVSDQYPIDERFADITRDGTAELLVTVYGCPGEEPATYPGDVKAREMYATDIGFGPGYAAYVYNLATDPPTRLFGEENGAIDITPAPEENGELLVIRSSWAPRDDPCCPTDQSLTWYRWAGANFVEVAVR